MQFELLDEPVFIVRSALPENLDASSKDTLLKIESLLEDEIDHVREEMDEQSLSSSSSSVIDSYFVPFSLHLQNDQEVISVVMEKEWKMVEGTSLLENEAEDIDCQLSELMRVVKIHYQKNSERREIYSWLLQQKNGEDLPLLRGLGMSDYLLLPAKNILQYMSSFPASSRQEEDN